MDDQQRTPSNRETKLRGREKRRRHAQGTRAYLHAVVNSVARRARPAERVDGDREASE